MDSYTITITPNDDSGNSTTLTVDTSTGQARIIKVDMQAPAGLTSGHVPGVDIGLLLQAVAGSTRTPAVITAVSTPVLADSQPTVAGDEPPITVTTAAPAVAAPARRTGSRRAAGARSAAAQTGPTSGERRRRSQPAPKATAKAAPRKAARKRTPAAAAGSERAYRRMPDDFGTVYRQGGTAAAIAEHYGVPSYTVQGWITRLKKQNPGITR